MWSSCYPLTEDEQRSLNLIMDGIDWKDLSSERQASIKVLVDKYPDIAQTAVAGDKSSVVSSTALLSQRADIYAV
jgi:hypothetical protein